MDFIDDGSDHVQVDTGTWTGDATITFTYQWQKAENFDDGGMNTWVDIFGETDNILQPVDDFISPGDAVRCIITAQNDCGDPVEAESDVAFWDAQ